MRKKDTNKRLPRVLLVYREFIPSIRLCGHMQMEYLASIKKIEYKTCTMKNALLQNMDWPDIVMIGRLDSWQEYEYALRLKRKGKYIIYILDDDLLNVPMALSSAFHYHSIRTQVSISALIELSDAILSPSSVLLEKYAKNKRAILTEEPAVAPIDYKPNTEGVVKIGFAGSIDRTGDIESILEDVYYSIAEEYGQRVKFSFFGAIPSFAAQLDAEVIPYTNSYTAYREQMNKANWDIGLAPMPDTPFCKCKHYNKFIEYAAAGTMGIFSECGPYVRLKNEIGIGVFCNNESKSWYYAIKRLIDNPQERELIRERANAYAKDKLSIECIAKRLYEENLDIFSYRAPGIEGNVYEYMLLWFQRAISRCCNLIKMILKRTPGFRNFAFYFAETRLLDTCVEELAQRINVLSEQNRMLQEDYNALIDEIYKSNDVS